MPHRVLFYVQHLLGIGHLVRASRIAAALAMQFDVLLVTGGEPLVDVEFGAVRVLQLPPVRSGEGGFKTLVHLDGTPFGDADRAHRRDLLLAAFDAFAPDVLLTEAFPFGRRAMNFELLPLLRRARSAARRPLIACSVRDILQEMRPERQAETTALVEECYDLVLVHGDPGLITLPESFPPAATFQDRIAYTGMVGPVPEPISPDDVHDVIVSAGGGAVGGRLLETALAARRLTSLRGARWLFLTGPNGRELDAHAARGGADLRAFARDLPARLAQARVSVSQAGYNTVADLVSARCRAVLVPFARGGETEQSRRAALFEARGLAVVLDEARLDPATLARSIEAALALPEHAADIALDGAARTAAILGKRLALRG